MLFNTPEFAVFLLVVFAIYWLALGGRRRAQNGFLLLASYFFYACWDWRFLSLIILSTLVDYTIARALAATVKLTTRRLLLGLSLVVNLGILGAFKYYNFFLDALYSLRPDLQTALGFNSLDVLLPVGISFYTFQTLSYTIDVYRHQLKPSSDLISFAAFVSFFPQLVAGPIERATNLLPQFNGNRHFDRVAATDGLRQILWGLVKKVVIADTCAPFVNEIFAGAPDMNASALLFGIVLFSFQIYGDFSGYSDIAIGTARLFGFNLKRNFAFPYFSRDVAEFWRRWHISLSTWFRDYLYIPIGGSRRGKWTVVRNVFIVFLVSGFWHGANWTFLAWGFMHALFFLPLLLTNSNRNHLGIVAQGKLLPSWREAIAVLITFSLVSLAWVFFRADSIGHAFVYLRGLVSPSLLAIPSVAESKDLAAACLLILGFTLVEWLGRADEYATETFLLRYSTPVRFAAYYLQLCFVFWCAGTEQAFIYFQF
ncbi:MBOAT family O-acyltransferase [Neolewinella antarctica]|uniref:D-alanyl-lipoteichoic acid acyltransferase DltB (MBOAT superfamily) n=1 Tax=Neolewinella antarctica TaxID=442734 RepID=A0ABX0XE77_9BACT|nr:MBOAT family protein [Neolewinella antarctica]NJC27062.1 D-alanyl-lipoteichoic acid acyltransferase DltB (MBOAT superfamily) [Neolewinella antarctica]